MPYQDFKIHRPPEVEGITPEELERWVYAHRPDAEWAVREYIDGRPAEVVRKLEEGGGKMASDLDKAIGRFQKALLMLLLIPCGVAVIIKLIQLWRG